MASLLNTLKARLARSNCLATAPADTASAPPDSMIAREHVGKHEKAFGKPTIGTVGSYVLNFNNQIGPAIVTLPGILHVCTSPRSSGIAFRND